jgi:hypothetical protein
MRLFALYEYLHILYTVVSVLPLEFLFFSVFCSFVIFFYSLLLALFLIQQRPLDLFF